MKTLKCPVCGKELLPNGLKNHIINKAKSEVFYDDNAPHKIFFDENSKELPNGRKTLKYTKIK